MVIDCVTLWISNLLQRLGGASRVDSEILDAVVRSARAVRGRARVTWVSNEVGSGHVPANALARRFADRQAMADHRLVEGCDTFHLCVARSRTAPNG